ncbi:MAG: hypothetical protein ABIN61_01820 [candidate division WOR-3 bacterium]
MKKKIFYGMMIFFFIIGCEEISDVLTTISGKVNSTECKVVLAIKGDVNLLNCLNEIDTLNGEALRDPDFFRGYDLEVDKDGTYSITVFSFGSTYIAAIDDDGVVVDRLDSLDHIGFYGEVDTIIMSGYDTIIYNKPKTIEIMEKVDQENINIENMVEYKKFVNIINTIF